MNLLSKVANQDIWILWVIGLFTFLVLGMLLVILIARSRYKATYKRVKKLRKKLTGIISMYVNYPDKSAKHIKRIHGIVKYDWQREMLADMVTELSYNMTGIYFDRAKELYQHFELRKLAVEKINSNSWDEVLDGIIQLSIMGDEKDYKLILPLLEHENDKVRRYAKIAIVELGKVDGLLQMKERIGTMSRWTFISILSILHRSSFKINKDQIRLLKESSNPSMRKLSQHLDIHSVAYN